MKNRKNRSEIKSRLFTVGRKGAEKEVHSYLIKICGYIEEKERYYKRIYLFVEKFFGRIDFEKYA